MQDASITIQVHTSTSRRAICNSECKCTLLRYPIKHNFQKLGSKQCKPKAAWFEVEITYSLHPSLPHMTCMHSPNTSTNNSTCKFLLSLPQWQRWAWCAHTHTSKQKPQTNMKVIYATKSLVRSLQACGHVPTPAFKYFWIYTVLTVVKSIWSSKSTHFLFLFFF